MTKAMTKTSWKNRLSTILLLVSAEVNVKIITSNPYLKRIWGKWLPSCLTFFQIISAQIIYFNSFQQYDWVNPLIANAALI